jgi:hypothetical protein
VVKPLDIMGQPNLFRTAGELRIKVRNDLRAIADFFVHFVRHIDRCEGFECVDQDAVKRVTG